MRETVKVLNLMSDQLVKGYEKNDYIRVRSNLDVMETCMDIITKLTQKMKEQNGESNVDT